MPDRSGQHKRTVTVLATLYSTRQALLADDLGRTFMGSITNAFDINGEEVTDLDEATALVIHVVIDGMDVWIAWEVTETISPGELH